MKRILTARRVLAGCVVLLAASALAPPGISRTVWSVPRDVVNTVVLGRLSEPLKYLSDHLRPSRAANLDPSSPDALLAQLVQERARAQQLELELAQARGQLQELGQVPMNFWSQSAPPIPIPARVTAMSQERGVALLSLDRGQSAGIQPGMVVISGYNLVGRVADAGGSWASVRLLLQPRAALAVRLFPLNGPPLPDVPPQGLAVSLGATSDGRQFAAQVKSDHPLARARPSDPGAAQWLAHLADPSWPQEAQGLVVGKLVAVEPWTEKNPLLFSRLLVEPVVSLSGLQSVIVLAPHNPQQQAQR